MFPHVAQAEHRSGYKVWLKFEDGAEGVVDLEPELTGPVFEPLRKPEEFRKFKVHEVAKTLVWPNGADFAPEFLKSKMA
jgi:hypothetical protein